MDEGRNRVVIEHVKPIVDNGRYPIKRAIGEPVVVRADIFSDGHDAISAVVLYKGPSDKEWLEIRMEPGGNDSWKAKFITTEIGEYRYTVKAWIDRFRTWRHDLQKRYEAGQKLQTKFLAGAELLKEFASNAPPEQKSKLQRITELLQSERTDKEKIELLSAAGNEALIDANADRLFATLYPQELSVTVERAKALFSTWYERFPRSCSSKKDSHGTFSDCITVLPEIARMGFDVWYLPPIHPIGITNRKGKNNTPKAEKNDVGSPWAIGSAEGGHTAIHPSLGTMEDFKKLFRKAKEHGIEIALDMAFQCSPDHPYVKEHPEWFRWQPDGTVRYAENPPKKYEDIIPINFECEDWRNLWEELRNVVLFWAGNGVRIFRVDNPHTKPFLFWEWLIGECKKKYADIIFLSEAFTRPKVMYKLAKIGFTQSYTYFTWRNTKTEFTEYVTHLLNSEVREFFRPNFWPNTPDILPEHLQFGGRPAFMMRLLLAATLSSSYGIYGPPFELCVHDAVPGKEEYLDSEKYELRQWDWNREGNLKDFIARVNGIRRENEALQTTWNLRFCEADNEYLIFFAKANVDLTNVILVVINLDPAHTQSGWVRVPLQDLGIPDGQPYLVHELLTDDKYIWHGEKNFVQLDPHISPAHIFKVRKKLKRETDFDYFV